MRIVEGFSSWQGTGFHAGTKQFFVRTAGCSVPCPIRKICDEQGALDHSAGEEMSFAQCLERWPDISNHKWLHITGGEPTEQKDLYGFMRDAQSFGLMVQCQTSLHRTSATDANWTTMSPKGDVSSWNGDVAPSVRNVEEAVIVADDSISIVCCEEYRRFINAEHWYVSPAEVNGIFNIEKAALIADTFGWKLTGQLHKQWGLE